MANRVEKKEYNKNKLVIEEFIQGELVALKDGEVIEAGQVLVFDTTEKKYVKYDKATHKTLLGTVLLRVYKGQDKITASDGNTKATVLRQGIINKSLLKGIEFSSLDEDDYKLIASLEQFNIYIEEVK